MRCDAGRGCAIDCPKQTCVAMWDELNMCQKACLDGSPDNIRPIKIKGRFRLSLRARGRQVKALFEPYLPSDLADGLDHDEMIELDLRDAHLPDLLRELQQRSGGMLSS